MERILLHERELMRVPDGPLLSRLALLQFSLDEELLDFAQHQVVGFGKVRQVLSEVVARVLEDCIQLLNGQVCVHSNLRGLQVEELEHAQEELVHVHRTGDVQHVLFHCLLHAVALKRGLFVGLMHPELGRVDLDLFHEAVDIVADCAVELEDNLFVDFLIDLPLDLPGLKDFHQLSLNGTRSVSRRIGVS
eukprot:CAMPEP_0170505800 /NCGR_PEP_ID=MMETSP0208-20121228/52292_1 /TAXON_ID=197538 /ORGANISM="Strombidium inclinatum, Strain S3" /LENGTH=190 /DNA_ID=CAMNT_0010786891 /DNA_START=642 /DNA_END=1214 /DNA_ORIENTATION=+